MFMWNCKKYHPMPGLKVQKIRSPSPCCALGTSENFAAHSLGTFLVWTSGSASVQRWTDLASNDPVNLPCVQNRRMRKGK